MVVEDEMNLQEWPNPCYRWSKKGDTPIMKVHKSKESMKLYGGLSLKTQTEIVRVAKAMDSEETIRYLELIKRVYYPQLTEGQKILLVWDNASFHGSNEVKEWLRKENVDDWLELWYFPTYSPELNPQEHVWKALRAELSKVVHKFTFSEVCDRACRILKTTKYNYKFF